MKLFSKKQHRAGGPGPIAQYIERAYIYCAYRAYIWSRYLNITERRAEGRTDRRTDDLP